MLTCMWLACGCRCSLQGRCCKCSEFAGARFCICPPAHSRKDAQCVSPRDLMFTQARKAFELLLRNIIRFGSLSLLGSLIRGVGAACWGTCSNVCGAGLKHVGQTSGADPPCWIERERERPPLANEHNPAMKRVRMMRGREVIKREGDKKN